MEFGGGDGFLSRGDISYWVQVALPKNTSNKG